MASTRPSTSRDVRRIRRAIPSSTIPASTRRRCETATGFVVPGVQTQFVAGMVNLKRDPFETGMGEWKKANFWMAGALAGPGTAWVYDWNMLPIGQALWLKELESY